MLNQMKVIRLVSKNVMLSSVYANSFNGVQYGSNLQYFLILVFNGQDEYCTDSPELNLSGKFEWFIISVTMIG